MISSARQAVLDACADLLAKVEIELIEWAWELREFKEKIDAEVPA
jgi:hypothetical protein